jgi:hypothetical protein
MPIINNGKEDENLTMIAVREIFWEIFGLLLKTINKSKSYKTRLYKGF